MLKSFRFVIRLSSTILNDFHEKGRVEAEKAELIILVSSYKTSPLFLVVVLRNIAKTRLACLHYTYDVTWSHDWRWSLPKLEMKFIKTGDRRIRFLKIYVFC